MPPPTIRFAPAFAFTMVVVLGLLASCTETPEPDATEVVFSVDPSELGPEYSNRDVGVRFRPPVGWELLEPAQRDLIAAALVEQQAYESYTRDLVDLFLSTETLSFASLSIVGDPDGSPLDASGEAAAYADSYANALATTLADTESPEREPITVRGEFAVDGIAITQFRYAADDRINFSLLFGAASGRLVQLDYSIPAAAFEAEIGKLESSIGSLSRP